MCKYIYISFISICGFIFFCFKKINNGEIEKLEEEEKHEEKQEEKIKKYETISGEIVFEEAPTENLLVMNNLLATEELLNTEGPIWF